MKENKIQSECVRWFKNDYLPQLEREGFLCDDECMYFRALLHSNPNEMPVFKYTRMPKNIRSLLDGWIRNIKSMGLTAGVADVSFKAKVLIEGVRYGFLEIEFKDHKGKQSERQKIYERSVNYSGGYYKLIRSVDEFKVFIKSINFICRND